jgi:DHA3 family macrolide efflux protein-like MFS transporter
MRRLQISFRRPHGMRGLFVIWLGQMVSGIASSITTVALPIWIFGVTSSGTAVGLLEFFYFGSYILVVMFAGVLIDRYPRKMMMLVYDFTSLSAMAILLVLHTAGNLEVWHLYIAAVFQGVGFAFQSPSYAAAITTMIPRKQYIQANGLMSLLYDAPGIFGPLIAGTLYMGIGLSGILAFNLLTFVFSIGLLLFVEIPSTPRPHAVESRSQYRQFLREAIDSIKYIFQRPGLLGLQLIFFLGNLYSGIALSVAALYPMILLRTGNNTEAVGTIQSVGALAAVLSGIILTTWGGIKRPIHAILLGWIFSSLLGLTLLGIGQVLLIWLIAIVIDSILEPVVNVSIDTFLQTKVPPHLQGRVFSASDFIAQAMVPFTPLLAGFFGDRIFEPAMREGGSLANTFGWLVGTGPGAGFGLLILICGLGGTFVGLAGYLIPSIRRVDKTLPDYQSLPPVGMVRRIRLRTANKNVQMMVKKIRRPKPSISKPVRNPRNPAIKTTPRNGKP